MKPTSFVLVALLGLALATPLAAQTNTQQRPKKGAKLFKRLDINKDQQISRAEWSRKPKAFDHLDRNNDGVLTVEEIRQGRQPRLRSNNNSNP